MIVIFLRQSPLSLLQKYSTILRLSVRKHLITFWMTSWVNQVKWFISFHIGITLEDKSKRFWKLEQNKMEKSPIFHPFETHFLVPSLLLPKNDTFSEENTWLVQVLRWWTSKMGIKNKENWSNDHTNNMKHEMIEDLSLSPIILNIRLYNVSKTIIPVFGGSNIWTIFDSWVTNSLVFIREQISPPTNINNSELCQKLY